MTDGRSSGCFDGARRPLWGDDLRIQTHQTSCEWYRSVIRFRLDSDFMRSVESVRIHADFRAHSGFRIDVVCITPKFSMRHAMKPFQGRYPVLVNDRPITEHRHERDELVHVDELPS